MIFRGKSLIAYKVIWSKESLGANVEKLKFDFEETGASP